MSVLPPCNILHQTTVSPIKGDRPFPLTPSLLGEQTIPLASSLLDLYPCIYHIITSSLCRNRERGLSKYASIQIVLLINSVGDTFHIQVVYGYYKLRRFRRKGLYGPASQKTPPPPTWRVGSFHPSE